jgi:hypothetical protein
MHAVPFDRAERLENRRACSLRFFELFGAEKFEPDFTLSRRAAIFFLPFRISAKQRSGCGAA